MSSEHKPHSELVRELQAMLVAGDRAGSATAAFYEKKLERLEEQLEAQREALEQADRLLDDVYAKGEQHAGRLLNVRTLISATLRASNPAISLQMSERESPLVAQADELGVSSDRAHGPGGLPDDLARVLRDQSIIVPQDQSVFERIAEWQNAPSDTASACLCKAGERCSHPNCQGPFEDEVKWSSEARNT